MTCPGPHSLLLGHPTTPDLPRLCDLGSWVPPPALAPQPLGVPTDRGVFLLKGACF